MNWNLISDPEYGTIMNSYDLRENGEIILKIYFKTWMYDHYDQILSAFWEYWHWYESTKDFIGYMR